MALAGVKKPNFFILGAAKSGTTSLYHYLKQHPEIFMTAIKEPTFFCNGFQVVKNPVQYFKLYDGVTTETAIGEASHAYLTNPPTAELLKGLFPEAKFIVILRNPADRAYSLYHHMRRNGYEDINSFEKALEQEEFRRTSTQFRKRCPQYFYNYLYFHSGLYGLQLHRYFSLYNQNQFHILTLDQLMADPAKELKAIFGFLEIDVACSVKLARHNEGKATARLPWLQHLVCTRLNNANYLREFGRKLVQEFNMVPIPEQDPEVRTRLLQRYAPDLKLLKKLTGISFA